MELSLNIDGEYRLEKGFKLIHLFLLVSSEHWSCITPAKITLAFPLD